MVRPQQDPSTSIYALMAHHLRHLRVYLNLTQEDIGRIIGCSKSQVSKYETGDKQLGLKECQALDAALPTGGIFVYLYGYARLGTDANWRRRVDFFQREAGQIRIWSNNLIPVPFQTEDYARSLLEAGHASGLVEDVALAVERRMTLQSAILKDRPQIWLVLDEAALRPMGDVQMMRAQFDHVIELLRPAHMSMRIVPLSAAPHIGIDGSFWSFEMPDRRLAAFAGTVLDVGRVIDDQTEAATVILRFERIAARAWSEDQSHEFLEEMREGL